MQLLCAGLYPATTQVPVTAATINALEHFHLLTFESKTSAFKYHNTLSRLTDNTRTEDIPVSQSINYVPTLLTKG